MGKVENRPFYQADEGFGVMLNGGCGFKIRDLNYEGKNYSCLTILPLKYQQEVGIRHDDNDIMCDQGFLELAFASSKSVDVLIKCLRMMKEICFNERTCKETKQCVNQLER